MSSTDGGGVSGGAIGKFKKYHLDDKALLVRSRHDKPLLSSVLRKGSISKSRKTGNHELHVKKSTTQHVALTSEYYRNEQFDHYVVVRKENSKSLFVMAADEMIMAPARPELTAAEGPAPEESYVEQRIKFASTFMGEKQKRQALQKAKKTKIHEHEIDDKWAGQKSKQSVTALMNATLSKKKKF